MMKKYLMTGVAALTLCAGFTSCSKNDIEPLTPAQIDKAKYDQAFLNYVGGSIASGQDWGFSASVSGSRMTRTVVKKDMTNFPKTGVPAAITDAERKYVTKWFQENPGLTEVGKDWKNFYIQYVSGDVDNKKGMWHRHDPNRFNNTGLPNDWDEEFTDNGGMDYLIVSDGANYTEHVLDFNAKSGGPWGIVYMENSSALKFGYHSSWDSNDYQYFKLVEIDVPGVGKGWYVGLSLYGKKYDNGDKELGIQRLNFAEDWILKVVPGETIPDETYDIRIMGEDLSAQEAGDFDFNDVVLDVKFGSSAKLCLRAAGGTLPLRIDGNDAWEVHALFGLNNTSTMVNTTSGKHTEYEPVPLELHRAIYSAADARSIKLEVWKNNRWQELTAEISEPAAKIAIPVTTGTDWLNERQSIKDEKKEFVNWATQNKSRSTWWTE